MTARDERIARAAERFVATVKLDASKEGESAVMRYEGSIDALTGLIEAIAQPAPSWSSSPPAKPGDYFACDTGAGAKPFVTTVRRTFDPTHHGKLVFTDQRGMTVLATSLGYEWWSEPIVAPPR